MREQFINNLEDYNDLVVKKGGLRTEHERSQIDAELYDLIGKTFKERGTSAHAQRDIYHLQEKKHEIMVRLKKQLVDLDSPEYGQELSNETRFVRYHEGKYFDLEGGQLSLGALLTDSEWGINYNLDSRTVPREVRKKFIIAQAKLELQNFFDQQIIINETSRFHTDEFKREAYRHIKSEHEHGHESMGCVAEKMVRNFLKKLSINFPELDFEVEKADVFQDVQQKIDFIIHRRPHQRGVRVKVPAGVESAGIQFTTNLEAGNILKKEHQVDLSKQHLTREDAIDDIVIVTMPLEEIAPAYDRWKKKKTSGGPDELWPEETKEQVFRNVTKGLMTAHEVDSQWEIVSGQKFTPVTSS